MSTAVKGLTGDKARWTQLVLEPALKRAPERSGPFRREHVDEANERIWLGYKFDADQSRNLSLALRRFLALNTANPVTVSRLPDADARLVALDAILRRLSTGELAPEAAMAEATAAWKALDAKVPADALTRQRRNAVGLP